MSGREPSIAVAGDTDNTLVLKYQSHSRDEKGLHIKYQAADTKFNREKWGITFEKIQDGLNQPFVLTSGKVSYGPYGIFHPVLWGLNPYGAYPDINTERAYSWDFAIGYCSDLSRTSEVAVASMRQGEEGEYIYPTMTITDEKAIDEFLDDESLIPRSISIGIIGYHKNEQGLYDDYNVFQWAAVPDGLGAYGHKAKQIALCTGTKKECLPQLKVASLTPRAKDYCVATALKDLKEYSSYDTEKPDLPQIKVAGENKEGQEKKTDNSPVKIMQIKPEYIGQVAIPPKQDKPETNNTSNNDNSQLSQVLEQVKALNEKVSVLEKGNALKDREMEIRKITPQFIYKSRDDYEKAIKENLESDKSIAHISDVYAEQLKNFALHQNAPQPSQPTFTGEVAGGVPDAVAGGQPNGGEVRTASSEEAIKKARAANEVFDLMAGSFLGGSM